MVRSLGFGLVSGLALIALAAVTSIAQSDKLSSPAVSEKNLQTGDSVTRQVLDALKSGKTRPGRLFNGKPAVCSVPLTKVPIPDDKTFATGRIVPPATDPGSLRKPSSPSCDAPAAQSQSDASGVQSAR